MPLFAALGLASTTLAQNAGGETRIAATDVSVEPARPPDAPAGGYLEVGEGLAAALESEPAERPPTTVRAPAKPRVTRTRSAPAVNKDAPLALIADTLDRSGTNISTTIPDR